MSMAHRAVFLWLATILFSLGCQGRPAELAEVKKPDAPAAAPAFPARNGPSLTVLALGDYGTGGAGQKRNAQAMQARITDAAQTLLLTLGDNIYPDGVTSNADPVLDARLKDIYGPLGVDILPTLGNHDHRGDPEALVAYSKRFERWKMPARYYTVDRSVGGITVRFIALDTQALLDGDTAQLDFLDQTLAKKGAQLVVAFGHHPLYSHGPHGPSPAMIKMLRQRFLSGSVDIYLAGHEHTLELTAGIDETVHVVSGGGGGDDNPYPLAQPDATTFSTTGGGFAELHINAQGCDIGLLSDTGELHFVYSVPVRRPARAAAPGPTPAAVHPAEPKRP